eukprot:TRINITY_DN3778_c0_g3_i1.p1 TRINITY_DN3778_c0_g3~~TRINITY_DN3778_c0_g3_i1.p1  ORF type:complete len:368 (-),score=64.14 TRINITY_DN3778_c0_g3_i1:93-1196(-)
MPLNLQLVLVAFLTTCAWIADARLGSLTTSALTSSTFEAFIRGSDKVLVDFVDKTHNDWAEQKNDMDAALREVRNAGSQVSFATVDVSTEAEKSLAQRYIRNDRYPQLLWFQHGEASKYHRTLRSAKGMADFVLALDRDPVSEVSSVEEAAASYNRVVVAETSKGSPLHKVFEVVAAKHMDTIAFAYVQGTSDKVQWLEEGKEVENKEYDGKADSKMLDRWVVGNFLKSEPIPEGHPLIQDGSLVTVGKTFEETVLQKDKDVFIAVYAPWCGFSRKFLPVWNAFARAVSGVKHLVVAKIDGDQNSSPLEEFTWSSYPTVLFVKAGSEYPIQFHGNRTVSNLLQFARDHGSQPINLDPNVNLDVENEL